MTGHGEREWADLDPELAASILSTEAESLQDFDLESDHMLGLCIPRAGSDLYVPLYVCKNPEDDEGVYSCKCLMLMDLQEEGRPIVTPEQQFDPQDGLGRIRSLRRAGYISYTDSIIKPDFGSDVGSEEPDFGSDVGSGESASSSCASSGLDQSV